MLIPALALIIMLCYVVYNDGGYVDLVGRMAEESMNEAVIEVKSLPDYTSAGEVGYECLINCL